MADKAKKITKRLSYFRRFSMLNWSNKINLIGALVSILAAPLTFILTSNPITTALAAGFVFSSLLVAARLQWKLSRMRSFEQSFRDLPAEQHLSRLRAEYGAIPPDMLPKDFLQHRRQAMLFSGSLFVFILVFFGWLALLLSIVWVSVADYGHAEDKRRLEAERDALTLDVDSLRIALDGAQRKLDELLTRERTQHVATARVAGQAGVVAQFRPSRETKALSDQLESLLAQFQSKASPVLGADDDRLVRLSKATVLLAKAEYSQAERMVSDEDAQIEKVRTDTQIGREREIVSVRAKSLYGLEKWEQALASYDRLMILRPSDLDAKSGRGRCLFQLGRLKDSLKVWNDILIELEPTYIHKRDQPELAQRIAAAYLNRSGVLAGLGNLAAAMMDVRFAVDFLAYLATKEHAAAHVIVGLVKSQQHMAALLADQGKPIQALSWLDQATATFGRLGSSADENSSLQASLLNDCAIILLEAGRDSEAIIAADKAVALCERAKNPNAMADILINRAQIQLEFHALDKAEQDASRAISVLNDVAQSGRVGDVSLRLAMALRTRATVYAHKRKVKEASADCMLAIGTLVPLINTTSTLDVPHEAALIYSLYGQVLLHAAGRNEERLSLALKALDEADVLLKKLRMKSSAIHIAVNLASSCVTRFHVLYRLNRKEESRVVLMDALRVFGEIHAREGDPYGQSIESEALLHLGLIEVDEGDTKNGIDRLNKSVEIARGLERTRLFRGSFALASAVFARGRVYVNTGNVDLAQADMNEAEKLYGVLSQSGDRDSEIGLRNIRELRNRLIELKKQLKGMGKGDGKGDGRKAERDLERHPV
jgi:tetratricopeptide (TPR) repeat protein